MDDDLLGFNFWPSFADIMLATVLILIIILFLIIAGSAARTINLEQVNQNQMTIIDSISKAYGVEPKQLEANKYGIDTTGSNQYDIIVSNEPTLQRIYFANNILFDSGKYSINSQGQKALSVVGMALKEKLFLVREIQIQGHADTKPPEKQPSNMYLASLRALAVYDYMQTNVGIEPAEQLMSATSFGEFKPVQRHDDDMDYNYQKLTNDNDTAQKMQANRRIELLLFYSTPTKGT